jgi:hypothetical protein
VKRYWQLLLFVLMGGAFIVLGGSAWGQATTSLRGVVTDPSGAAIPNATVHLVNVDTSIERTATTDQQGSYVFAEVQPGNYVLRVESAGFSTYEQKGFQLLVNLPTTINVKMKVGAASTTVEVTAAAPLLNTTDASQGNTMSGGQISDMPLYGRNVAQLLSVQPGVVFTSNRSDLAMNDTRSGAVNGAHSDQNNITLDGVDVNDQGNGSPFETVVPVTVASVEEFRVTTADYGAEQGRSSGAQSALVTKGGTNVFHGSAYEYNRTDFGEANDFFNKSTQADIDAPNKPLHLVYNIFGADLGGPIKHDRAFFFFNYEGHREDEAVTAQRSIPSPTLADGIIQYPCATPSQCPAGTIQGASGNLYNVSAGDFAIGPNNNSGGFAPGGLKQMDPLGIGPSAASMAYFQTYLNNPAVKPNPNNDPLVGDGLGLNYDGFLFAPVENLRDDIGIGRIDYKLTANGSQTLFWRGSGQDNYVPGEAIGGSTAAPPGGAAGSGAPLLPGGPNQGVTSDFSKGMVAGYTVLLGSNVVNNFRYGFTRQSIASTGDSDLPFNAIRGLNQDEGNYTTEFNFPVHDFTDDVSWTKGKHTFDFGGDLILTFNNSSSTAASFSSGTANSEWLNTGGFAETGNAFDPDNYFPAIQSGFDQNYDWPLVGLLGMITEVNAQYQNHANSDGSAFTLPEGTPIPRHYEMRESELYAQDSFKIKPNLTFNYGLRYEQITPPWETDGQESAPTQDLGTWFEERGQGMMRGVPANQAPIVSFDLAGRSNGRPDWWANGNDFAPRFSVAWSPEPSQDWLKKLVGGGDKTVVRAGFGKYYDHYGQAMIETFDTSGGEFGLSALLVNPANVESSASSARWAPIPGQPLTSAVNNIPDINPATGTPYVDPLGNPLFTPQPAVGFPATLPPGNFCICWGIDSSLKTPYSYALDFSISRELPHNMAIEVAYVGRLGHDILLQSDLAQPLNLVDPKSGISFYQAAAAMATLGRAKTNPTNVTSSTIGPTAAYWNDLISPVAAGDQYNVAGTVGSSVCGGQNLTNTTDPVTAIYETYLCSRNNETDALFIYDVLGIQSQNNPSNFYFANTGPYTWFDSQYSSLFAWRSQGWSHYNSMQVTFKKQMSQGVEFNFNYTYSTSFDLASDAESVGEWDSLSGNVVNPWMGDQLSGPSDFDLRHQINAQYIWQLPFGQGRLLASHIGKGLNAVIGGWELSGLTRWSSGFPVSAGTCACYVTNWQLTGDAISPVQITGGHYNVLDPSGTRTYNIFNDPSTVFNEISVPLPGQSGSRNPFRGDGFFNTDMELGKIWKMPYNESHSLKFTADMFNVFNMNRFDVQSLDLAIDTPEQFGDYTRLLTLPRVMQFGLQYNF